MMKKLFWAAVTACCFAACNFSGGPGKQGTVKGNDIPRGLREQIHRSNVNLLKALQQEQMGSIKNFLSDGLIAMMDTIPDSIILAMGKDIRDSNFRVLNEYYTRGAAGKEVSVRNTEGEPYTLRYTPAGDESYVCLLQMKGPQDATMLVNIIYNKHYTNWLVDGFRIGVWSYEGKGMGALCRMSKEELKDSLLVDAYMHALMASNCAHASPFLTFEREKKATQLQQQIEALAGARYHFPLPVSGIATHPQVTGLNIRGYDNYGYCAVVFYRSSIPLGNTDQLRAENLQLRKQIGSLFKGIDRNKRYLLYKVHNNEPVAGKPQEVVTFADTLLR